MSVILSEVEQQYIDNLCKDLIFDNNDVQWANKRKKSFDCFDSFKEFSTAFSSTASTMTLNEYKEILSHTILSSVSTATKCVVKKLSKTDYEILDYFRWSINDDGVLIIFVKTHFGSYKRIPDIETGARCTNNSAGERIITEIKRNVVKAVEDGKYVNGITYKKDNVHIDFGNYFFEMNRMFMLDEAFEMPFPEVISNDQNVPAMFYFDINRLQPLPHPEWNKWLNNRMEPYYHDVFKAWMFSTFMAKNTSRQILWLHDAGGTGKTSVYKAIANFMDNVGFASINDKSFGNQFGMSSIFGSRLVVNGDCKDPNFCSSFEAHQISGGDLVRIEFKGATPFMYESKAKILICSNLQPKINVSAFNESSRLIFIPLRDNTQISKEYADEFIEFDETSKNQKLQIVKGDLADKLTAEISGFLHSCKDSYDKLCPYHGNIKLPEEALEEMFGQCASNEVVYFEEISESYLDFSNPRSYMTAQDLLSFMKENADRKAILDDTKRYGNFLRYLKETYGVTSMKKTITIEGVNKRKNVYMGMKIKSLKFDAKITSNDTKENILSDEDKALFKNHMKYDEFISNHLNLEEGEASEDAVYERFICSLESNDWNDFKSYLLQAYELLCDDGFPCKLR